MLRHPPLSRGNVVQGPLNYRGLSRPTVWIGLLFSLIVSSYVAAIPMLIVALPAVALTPGSVAFMGIVVTGALVAIPVWALVAGSWGVMNAKGRAIKFFGAQKLPRDHGLSQTVAAMAAHISLPTPEVYVYPDDDINAWATGTPFAGSAVGVSQGALERLSREHMHAVIGHELGHIASGDIVRMQFALSFQNATVGYFLFRGMKRAAAHSVGFVGQLGILGMSRRREYWADAVGAVLTSPQTMSAALRVVEQEAKRPPKQRKYLQQLMFNWPGGSLLASHPTFDQRLAALHDGHHYAAALRKVGYASAGLQGHDALSARRQFFSQLWLINRAPIAGAAIAVLFLLAPGLWYSWSVLTAAHPAHVAASAPVVVAVPAAPSASFGQRLAPVAGPKVAAWSRAEAPVVPSRPVVDDLAYEPPGYRCFKLLERRLPSGLTHTFDEQKDRSVYAATTASSASALRELPNALRSCLKQSGGKLQPQSSSVENRKIEIWAFAGEISCWFTPATGRNGAEPLSILGRCHSPED